MRHTELRLFTTVFNAWVFKLNQTHVAQMSHVSVPHVKCFIYVGSEPQTTTGENYVIGNLIIHTHLILLECLNKLGRDRWACLGK
jgi:hypothetical protein